MLQNTEHDMPVMIFPRPIGRWQPASGAPGFLCGLWLSTWLQNNRIGSSNGVSGNEVETVPIGPIGPIGWRTMMINRPMDSKTNPQVFRVYCLGMLYPLTPYIDLIDRYGRYLRKKFGTDYPVICWPVRWAISAGRCQRADDWQSSNWRRSTALFWKSTVNSWVNASAYSKKYLRWYNIVNSWVNVVKKKNIFIYWKDSSTPLKSIVKVATFGDRGLLFKAWEKSWRNVFFLVIFAGHGDPINPQIWSKLDEKNHLFLIKKTPTRMGPRCGTPSIGVMFTNQPLKKGQHLSNESPRLKTTHETYELRKIVFQRIPVKRFGLVHNPQSARFWWSSNNKPSPKSPFLWVESKP